MLFHILQYNKCYLTEQFYFSMRELLQLKYVRTPEWIYLHLICWLPLYECFCVLVALHYTLHKNHTLDQIKRDFLDNVYLQ